MKSKKEMLLEAIKNENWKQALSIAKGFKHDFNKDEQKIIQHGYSFIIGQSANFFEALNINMEDEYQKAIEILKTYSEKFIKIEPFLINESLLAEKLQKRRYEEWGFKEDTEDN